MIILRVTKIQGLILILENIFLGKSSGEGSNRLRAFLVLRIKKQL